MIVCSCPYCAEGEWREIEWAERRRLDLPRITLQSKLKNLGINHREYRAGVPSGGLRRLVRSTVFFARNAVLGLARLERIVLSVERIDEK